MDDRGHVERPDPRVRAVVAAQGHELHRPGGTADHGVGELAGGAGERVRGAVMVGVGVDVEQPGAERAAIAATASRSRPSDTFG